MEAELKFVRIGFTNVFFIIQDGKCLIVDTGTRGEEKKLLRAISNIGCSLKDVKYIFLTHTHYDHAGSAAGLKALSGAQVIVHESEAEYLKNGFTPIPKGTSAVFKLISKAGKLKNSIEKKVAGYPPLKPDILFKDVLSLDQYGFNAEVRHIPGHTLGSSGLILGDKAIVGDCMFNLKGRLYPGFADDENQLVKTWKQVLKWNVNWFYPGHGKRFNKVELLKAAAKKGIK